MILHSIIGTALQALFVRRLLSGLTVSVLLCAEMPKTDLNEEIKCMGEIKSEHNIRCGFIYQEQTSHKNLRVSDSPMLHQSHDRILSSGMIRQLSAFFLRKFTTLCPELSALSSSVSCVVLKFFTISERRFS